MEAERDEGVAGGRQTPWKRLGMTEANYRHFKMGRWLGAIVTRDTKFTGGVGRVISEPGDDGIAWVYWGASDEGRRKHETREVVAELVRLDTNEEFMRTYRRSDDE